MATPPMAKKYKRSHLLTGRTEDFKKPARESRVSKSNFNMFALKMFLLSYYFICETGNPINSTPAGGC
jgi:hypothetical protein